MVKNKDGMKLKGFYRVQIEEDGNIVGDSGVVPVSNTITNLGIEKFAVGALGALSGSSQIAYFGLGSGTIIASDGTALPGECLAASKRATFSATSFASRTNATQSATFSIQGLFASSASFVTATFSIANIGIFAANTVGTAFCGATFASSTLSTNQNVNVTYQLNVG